MNATSAKISHWTLVLALVGACAGAVAQTTSDETLVWVENDNFEFATCASAPVTPSPEQIAATMNALRAQASAGLDDVLHASGVQMNSRRFLLLTPVEGKLACDGRDSQITFRATAVDQRAINRRWTTDLTVGGASSSLDRTTMSRLAGELAGQFGVAVATAVMK